MKLDASAFVADHELIRALRERATPVECSQDRVLFLQGDSPLGLYILVGGEVTLTLDTDDGNHVVSLPAIPGSLLGLPALVSNHGYSLSAFAKGGAEISFVPREDFSKLMLSEPLLAMMILRVLAAEVRTARMAITSRSA